VASLGHLAVERGGRSAAGAYGTGISVDVSHGEACYRHVDDARPELYILRYRKLS